MSRILVLSHSWEPDESPPQRRMRLFADSWLSTRQSVTLITATPITENTDHHSKEAAEHHLRILRTPTNSKRSSLIGRMIEQGQNSMAAIVAGSRESSSHELRPDLVLATVPALPTAFAGYALSKRYGIPLIIDLRDAWPDLIENLDSWDEHSAIESPLPFLKVAVVKILSKIGAHCFKSVLGKASLIISTSEFLANQLRLKGHNNVEVIRNPVPSDVVASAPNLSRATITHESRELRILYAGTVGRAQGLGNAVEALAIAKRNGSTIAMRIVGSGSELSFIKKRALDLDVDIEFVDRVTRDEMSSHYEWADGCLVHLRDWPALENALPSKLVELMARGIPVCGAVNGEPAEIIAKTEAGQVVPAMQPGDLASLWTSWDATGVPAPNRTKVNNWLDEYADADAAKERFKELATMELSRSNTRGSDGVS